MMKSQVSSEPSNRLHAQLPAIYRWVELDKLTPSESSRVALDVQTRIIDALRQNPSGSYAFFGPPCTGKTTFSAALFHDAARRATREMNPRCWWVSMPDWLAETKNYELDKGKEPKLNTLAVKTAWKTPIVFVDEFDKVSNRSDFTINTIAALVDAVYRHGGQLVLTSNMARDEFAEFFGLNIYRRINERCAPIDLFTKVTV